MDLELIGDTKQEREHMQVQGSLGLLILRNNTGQKRGKDQKKGTSYEQVLPNESY